MYSDKEAISLIESRFPEISEELHEEIWGGLLHLQIAVFSHFAQSIIDSGDKHRWTDISNAFWELWKDCTPEVENALNVSFLEHLNFANGKKERAWAYSAMHPAMRKAWDEMAEYNEKLGYKPF